MFEDGDTEAFASVGEPTAVVDASSEALGQADAAHRPDHDAEPLFPDYFDADVTFGDIDGDEPVLAITVDHRGANLTDPEDATTTTYEFVLSPTVPGDLGNATGISSTSVSLIDQIDQIDHFVMTSYQPRVFLPTG